MQKYENRTIYECEVCGLLYAKREDAIQCEENHIDKLTEAKIIYPPTPAGFYSVRMFDGVYPNAITVNFCDGSKHIYKLLR